MFVMNLLSVVSHQNCNNESIDSESGVFVECPAKKLSDLGFIIVMSSKESPGPRNVLVRLVDGSLNNIIMNTTF